MGIYFISQIYLKSDFLIFRKLEHDLKGQRFIDTTEIQRHVTTLLKTFWKPSTKKAFRYSNIRQDL